LNDEIDFEQLSWLQFASFSASFTTGKIQVTETKRSSGVVHYQWEVDFGEGEETGTIHVHLEGFASGVEDDLPVNIRNEWVHRGRDDRRYVHGTPSAPRTRRPSSTLLTSQRWLLTGDVGGASKRHRNLNEGTPYGLEAVDVRRYLSQAVGSIQAMEAAANSSLATGFEDLHVEMARAVVRDVEHEVPTESQLGTWRRQANSLTERSAQLARLGLGGNTLKGEAMSDLVEGLSPAAVAGVAPILNNYFESTSTYLTDLERAAEAIGSITMLFDTISATKELKYDTRLGFKVFWKGTDEECGIESLSSGEQHVLMLIAASLRAKNKGGFLLIDEPELSLDSTWKRRLPYAIQSWLQGSGVSVILATHSSTITGQARERRASLTYSRSDR